PYIQIKYFMADNCNKKIRETLYTLLFADFFMHIARGKLKKFLPAIVPIAVKSATKFLIFNNCSGWTHPVSSSIVHSSYRYCDDFGRDLRQRVGTSRYCYDLYYVPTAIVFFAAERP
ncbi:MAG: hypothetical protein ACK55I_05615, partial [bacterium]